MKQCERIFRTYRLYIGTKSSLTYWQVKSKKTNFKQVMPNLNEVKKKRLIQIT